MRAISLLSFWKLKNALRTLLTDPRKLAPFLILLVVFGFSFTMMGIAASQPAPKSLAGSLDAPTVQAAIFLGMILMAFAVLDSGMGDSLLALSPSDVDYLFPSPISRRVVLAYRLPALMFSVFFLGGLTLILTRYGGNFLPQTGKETSPGWAMPVAVLLSIAIYMNVATFIAVRFPNRTSLRKVLLGAALLLGAFVAAMAWQAGSAGMMAVTQSPWLRAAFFPTTLAADASIAASMHEPLGNRVALLALIYVASLIPMFALRTNWYEQSIVSSERMSNLRQAARGGYASLMAAKASTYKHRGTKEYAIKPFGQGAMALFWAHLCAAAKRPWTNFVTPFLTGILVGALGIVFGIREGKETGYTLMGLLLFYSSMGFMGAAKTASEAAVRRRNLLSPLPISGKHSVMANLGVPVVSMLLVCLATTLTYAIGRGAYAPTVAFTVMIAFPLRLASRMALQYVLVLGYPDVADKVQQMLAQMVYYMFALPLLIAEALVGIPGAAFRSAWLLLIPVAVFEGVLLMLLLALAGKATERAVATGEPVSLWRTIRRK